MGMVFCNTTVDEDGRGLWYVYTVANFIVGPFLLTIRRVGCAEKGKPKAIRNKEQESDDLRLCSAEASPAIESRIVLTAKNQIGNRFASLPLNLGDSIQWKDSFTPTGTRTTEEVTITTSDSLLTTTTSDLSSATSSNTDTDLAFASSATTTNKFQAVPSATETPVVAAPFGGLGTAEKVGIAFGAVAGLILILGALFAIRTLRYRRHVDDSASGADHGEHANWEKGEGAAELATETSPVVGELSTNSKARPETLRSELAASSPTSPHSSRLSELSDHGMGRPAMHHQPYTAGMSPPYPYPPVFSSQGYPSQGNYATSFLQHGYSAHYTHQGYPAFVSTELEPHSAHFGHDTGQEDNMGSQRPQHSAMELPN